MNLPNNCGRTWRITGIYRRWDFWFSFKPPVRTWFGCAKLRPRADLFLQNSIGNYQDFWIYSDPYFTNSIEGLKSRHFIDSHLRTQ